MAACVPAYDAWLRGKRPSCASAARCQPASWPLPVLSRPHACCATDSAVALLLHACVLLCRRLCPGCSS
jgi:hypothetical protein